MHIRPRCLLFVILSGSILIGEPSHSVASILGDLNGDLRVDIRDQLILTQAWHAQDGSNPVIHFVDQAVELVARGMLRKPTGDIHASDLARIESLQIPISLDLNSLDDLVHFPPLRSFSLRGPRPNDFSPDLHPLASLHQIQTLQLSRFGGALQKAANVSPIGDLTTLTNLVLSDTAITGASSFASLTGLVELELSECNLADISFVSGMDQLVALDLQGNEVVDISPLQSLSNLRILQLGSNAVANIDLLAGMETLELVGLSCNEITNIKPLVDNPGIGAGDRVELGGNELDDISKNTYMPALEARGVEVSFPTRGACIGLIKENP
jgi:hypothetical protein